MLVYAKKRFIEFCDRAPNAPTNKDIKAKNHIIGPTKSINVIMNETKK